MVTTTRLMSVDALVVPVVRHAVLELTRTHCHDISKAKYDDLQKLCSKGTMPRELHGWFADLPSANSAIDATLEPAVSDSAEDTD